MGGQQSISPTVNLSDPPIADDAFDIIAGCYSNLILFRSGRIEIRTKDKPIVTRLLSMEPTCCCSSPSGWIIGFKTGHISEFDNDLHLLTTFCSIGSRTAHNGPIISVCINKTHPDHECYLMSISSGENALHLWNNQGQYLNSFLSNLPFTAICSTKQYTWLAESSCRVYSLDITTMTSIQFSLLSPIHRFFPINMGFGCICPLKDGSVNIISGTDSIAHFSYGSHPMINNIILLDINQKNGLITFAAVDLLGVLSTRILEVYGEEIDKISPFFCQNDDHIIAIQNGQIVHFKIQALKSSAAKLINDDIELPRPKIQEFFSIE